MPAATKSKKQKYNFLTDLGHREYFQQIQAEATKEAGRYLLKNPAPLTISSPKARIDIHV